MKNIQSDGRRFRRCVAASLLLLLILTVSAQAQFTTATTNGGVTITAYNGPGGAVSIPDTIDGLPVTGIGANAFESCNSLTSVTIPASVTDIGDFAFADCTGLTSIVIPDGITDVGKEVFMGCDSLSSVMIPNSVTSIESSAFEFCNNLTSVTIPDSVTAIADHAFAGCGLKSVMIPSGVTSIGVNAFGCPSLTAISVAAANSAFSSVGGVLFDSSQITLLQCPGGMIGSYTILEGVTSIAAEAFYLCAALSSVTIPGTVTNIGDDAFVGCAKLTGAFFLGNAPATIGSDVFSNAAAGFKIYFSNAATGFSLPIWNGYPSAGPPVATTGGVIRLNVKGVTVCGTVNPAGLATTSCFEYGVIGNPDVKTARVSIGSGTAGRLIFATVAGLKPDQSYFYQLVATNSAGTVLGGTQTFLTGSAAPGIPTLSISGTGETVVDIDAVIDSGNGTTNVILQYGPTAAYGKTTHPVTLEPGGAPPPAPVDLSALLPHTTYHVRCIAQNTQGTRYSKDFTFKTLPRFDMNGDGFSELLLSDSATGETTLLSIGSNTPPASGTLTVMGSAAGPMIPAGLIFCGAAEFNRNGTIGWVFSDSATNEVQIWTLGSGSSGHWTINALETGTFSTPSGSSVVGIADINGDGNPDLVLLGPDRKLTYWLLDGFTVIAQKPGPKLPVGYVVAGIDSLYNNGKLDLLIWEPTSGKTEIVALSGTALASITIGPSIPTPWQLVGVDMYTGTGAPNWLLYNPATQATQIWMMNGAKKVSAVSGPTIPPELSLVETK